MEAKDEVQTMLAFFGSSSTHGNSCLYKKASLVVM